MPSSGETIARPARVLLWLEAQRALLEASTLLPAAPVLRRAPRGDGHPVLVLPGFGAGDLSTAVLRRYLRSLGYEVHPWMLGRNLGPRGDLPQRLRQRVVHLHEESGRKLSLVGWSLGGIYARELARREGERVRQVISIGSPFRAGAESTNIERVVRRTAKRNFSMPSDEWRVRAAAPPPVPSTSVFSRSDGIAPWQACLEDETPSTDNVEVIGSHLGLGFNPAVLYVLADRLAQSENGWARFDRGGWRSLVYR